MFNFLTSNLQLPVNNDGDVAKPLLEIYRYCPKTQSTEVVDSSMTLTFATQDASFNQLNVLTSADNTYFILPTPNSRSSFQCQLQGYFDFTPEWYNTLQE